MAADYLWSGLYSRIRRKGKHVPVHLILRRIRRRTVQPLKAAQEARDFSRERFTGRVDVRNVASNKVMEKCGFIKEGTVRQGKMVSVYCNYNIYGMLREDYMSMQGVNS